MRQLFLSLGSLIFVLPPVPLSADSIQESLAIIAAGEASDAQLAKLVTLAGDPVMEVRSAALTALGASGRATPEVLSALERGLEFGDEVTRSNAASALIDLGEAGQAVLRRRATADLPLRSRLEALAALRSSVAGLEDPFTLDLMDRLFPEIERTIHRDPDPHSGSVLRNGTFADQRFLSDWLFIESDGGKGTAQWDQSTSRRPGDGSLVLEKTTPEGEIVLRSKQAMVVPAGKTVTLRLYFRADTAPSNAALQLLFERENGRALIGDVRRGHAAQSQTVLQNTAPGRWEQRTAISPVSKVEERYFVRIVLRGNPAKAWLDDIAAPAPPYFYDYPPGMRAAAEPPNLNVQEPASPVEAEVIKQNGRPRLVVNGKAIPPILYFNQRSSFGDYAGMSQIGKVPLMVTTVALNDVRDGRYVPFSPVWSTTDRFDFTTPLAWLDQAAQNAPESLFILNLNVSWPVEWAERNPTQHWVNAEGERAYGTTIHFRGFARELPKGSDPRLPAAAGEATRYRWLPSPFSEQAITDAGKIIAAFQREVEKKPYGHRVIGCFISGGHDGQFYTAAWPDYSEPALKAWREWLAVRYGSDEALRKAWHDESVTLSGASIPLRPKESAPDGFNDPVNDTRFADHAQFQAEAGLLIRERLATAFKQARSTKSIGMTWQLGSGRGQGSETIFPTSKGLDILVPQPAYERRRPGLSGGITAPLTSYGNHGRMVVKELDLRTWMRAGGAEIESYRLGTAISPAMFRSIVRKEAAQMMARGHGFWFYDISTGMFRDRRMMEVAAEAVRAYEELELENPTPYRSDVAMVFTDSAEYWARNGFQSTNYIRQTDRYNAFHLRESGLIFDDVYLSDLLNSSEPPPYKVLIFLNAWRLSDRDREAITQRFQNSGRLLVWNYAAGYVSDSGLSDRASSEVVGMKLRSEEIAALPRVALDNGRAPGSGEVTFLIARQGQVTRTLPQGARRFIIEDPEATVLGRYEDGTAAIALRRHRDWTSLYFGIPGTLDAELIADMAAEAGAHRLSRDRVVAEFNGRFLSLHGLQNGPVRLHLPTAGTLIDFDSGEEVGSGRDVALPLNAGETRWLKFTPYPSAP